MVRLLPDDAPDTASEPDKAPFRVESAHQVRLSIRALKNMPPLAEQDGLLGDAGLSSLVSHPANKAVNDSSSAKIRVFKPFILQI